MRLDDVIQSLIRPQRNQPGDIQLDTLILGALWLLLIVTGMGLRDPWPADEPRFALVARDMVATGNWLVPRVAGDIYADKPPLFFWLIAAFLTLTDSLRLSFLLPSVIAGLGTTLLVYDLARRLWSRETGLVAGISLLFTVQFAWQARQAQIDATLCLWTTLSLYGLLRHLLLGPAWRWYAVGWLAAGLGVITKGVGFLPLLVLIPFALLKSEKWTPRYRGRELATWWIGPVAFLFAVGVWLVPVLWMSLGNPELAAYRDEILFHQTITRYANAWHHNEPVWYFVLKVIPWLWLPLTALIPWLLPKWREAWRNGDLRVVLPLAWAVLVILFFSASSGKRGVYVLPAVPAFILASAPFLQQLASKRVPQRVLFAIGAFIASMTTVAAIGVLIRDELRREVLDTYGIDPLGPLALMGLATIALCIALRPRRGFLAYAAVLGAVLLVVSAWVNPAMNAVRSGERFIAMVEGAADPKAQLGIIGFKEQYMLQFRRPITHFGHARWREANEEAFDAARWLSESADRQLVVPESAKDLCFADAPTQLIGDANRVRWFLVTGAQPSPCATHGKSAAALRYAPRLSDSRDSAPTLR